MDLHQRHYLALGVQPGDSREKIRKAYRDLIRAWHPDRHGQDEPSRHQAEERSKQLNQAFQDLEAYYQEHGRLPLDPAPATSPVVANAAAPTFRPYSTTPPFEPRRPNQTSEIANVANSPTQTTARTLVFATLVLGWLVYQFWDSAPDDPAGSNGLAQSESLSNQTAALGTVQGGNLARAGFTVGSTMGDVFAVQGKPTRVEGNIWHYGEARVFFKDGKVVRWEDTTPPLLKTGNGVIHAQDGMSFPDHFARGASKTEVRAIQGSPLRESETAWEYGLSRVYFDRNGRVTNWDEAPLDPLRVKR